MTEPAQGPDGAILGGGNDAGAGRDGGQVRDRVVVVTPEGMAVSGADSGDDGPSPTELIEQPAKVMRIGSMIKQLLEEVRSAPLDEAGRARLAQIHSRSIAELEQGLAPELVEELRQDHPAVRRAGDAVGRRAPYRAGAARRLARGSLPRDPDRAVRPADGGARAAGADAPGLATRPPRPRRRPAGPGRDAPAGHGPVPLTPLPRLRRRADPLGNGVWRRAHDNFRRAVDRYHQLLERVPSSTVRDHLEATGGRLAEVLDEVHAVCVAAQRLAPSESDDLPGGHGGALLDAHRSLARGATLAAQSGEAVMLAVVAVRAQQLEEAASSAGAAARAVDQAAEQAGRAEELVRAAEQA